MPFIEGDLRAPHGARFAILASRWNPRIVDALVASAREAFAANGVDEAAVDVVRVPGAWELPVAARALAVAGRHAAIVALGCVVRGDTRHYEQVADGATPAWCTLSLSLPAGDDGFVDGFLDGFLALASAHGVALVGGDTTRGPLSACVTAHGFVAPGCALRRAGAGVGDDVWVSGTLGDAAAALAQWQAGEAIDPMLHARLDRPTPRVALGLALSGIASACIDVSDGLLADLGHLCLASGVGAEVEVDALPASTALVAAFDAQARRGLQATGGDDYELCFSAPPARREAIAAMPGTTRIGRIVAGDGVRAMTSAGAPWQPVHAGYQHFA